jgi:hypothetical protein
MVSGKERKEGDRLQEEAVLPSRKISRGCHKKKLSLIGPALLG